MGSEAPSLRASEVNVGRAGPSVAQSLVGRGDARMNPEADAKPTYEQVYQIITLGHAHATAI